MRSKTDSPKKNWLSSLRRSIAARIYLFDQKLNQFNERIRSRNFRASYVYVPTDSEFGRIVFKLAMLIDPDQNNPKTGFSASCLAAFSAHTHIPLEEIYKKKESAKNET